MIRNLEPNNPGIIRTSADLTWQQHQPGENTWKPGSGPVTRQAVGPGPQKVGPDQPGLDRLHSDRRSR
jgi:hypothetical protein